MSLVIGSVFGQDSIQLALHLRRGEVRDYHFTSTTKHLIENGNYAVKSTEKDVTINILNIDDNKATAEWTYNKIMFVNTTSQPNPMFSLINTLNKNMVIKYVINHKGVIQSITNHDEITLKVKQQVDSTIQQMGHDNILDPSLLENLKSQFEMILSSRELLDALILEDLYRFHELYGRSFQKHSGQLVLEKYMPDDGFAIKLTSANSKCLLKGDLVSTFKDKTGQKTYEFEIPSFWLAFYSLEWSSTVPTNFSTLYTITLTNR